MSQPLDSQTITGQRFWWITMARGVFSLLLGVAVLFANGDYKMLVNFVGVYWLLSGLLTIRWALTVRWVRGSRIGMAAGCVSVVAAGLVLLRAPLRDLISVTTLIDILGIAAVLTGCLRLLGAFEIERRTGRRWTFGGFALGSVEVVLGLVLFTVKEGDEQLLAIAFAAWGLVGGSLLLIEGLRLHHARARLVDPPTSEASSTP